MTPEVFFESEDGTSLARFSDILLLGHDWKEDETRLIGLLSSGYGGRIGVIGSRSNGRPSRRRPAGKASLLPISTR